MGRRGPQPTPTAVLAARGSRRAERRKGEPRPAAGEPACPAHLADSAKGEWARLVKLLLPLNLLTPVDGDALAMYCQAYARWAEAERELATQGTVVKSPNGYPIQNPYLAIANTAMQQMGGLLARFGMSPADRSRVQASPADAKPVTKPNAGPPALKIAQ